MGHRVRPLDPDVALFDVADLDGSGTRLTCPGCGKARAALLLVRHFKTVDAICSSCAKTGRRAARKRVCFPEMRGAPESPETAPVLDERTDGPFNSPEAA